eukprot:TRINITY_DN108486_c0_g1_i1.p1 TRINITY_DN108486_c0_g1~~TRINITY_DN108486_c0_g1_i1.p1  ORF type:complete len:247 (-),score=32.88 TRINITY_DN108486_c0_g1_i1:216-860(-)
MFVGFDREVIVQVLRANNGDMDKTVELLLESQQQQTGVNQASVQEEQLSKDEELAKALQEQMYLEAAQEQALMEAYQQGEFGNQEIISNQPTPQVGANVFVEGISQGVQSVTSTVSSWAKKVADAIKEGPSEWVEHSQYDYEGQYLGTNSDVKQKQPTLHQDQQHDREVEEKQDTDDVNELVEGSSQMVLTQQAGHMGQLRNRRIVKGGERKED